MSHNARVYGTMFGGMPFLSFGEGPPLVVLPGISSNHVPPFGAERRALVRALLPLARVRRVWWITRRPGLDLNATMVGLAADYARALTGRFDGPVDVLAFSTGGSVALQLAADHPDVVRRLVIVSAAYRLGSEGAPAQQRVAEELRAERPRRAAAQMFGLLGATALTRRAFAGLGWLIGPAVFRRTTADILATIHAEDGLDLSGRLHEISAPTLVIGGDRDAFYSPELFTETAAQIPHGRLLLYRGRGHAGTQTAPGFVQEVLDFLDDRPSEGAPPTARRRRRRA
jgi:pimeloyl-ACP methyl ester carboxylesterase